MLKLTIPMLFLIGAFIISVILLIILLVDELHNIKLTRRFTSFSMDSNSTLEPSFMDNLTSLFRVLLQKNSKLISKSHVLTNYAKKYDKYSVLYNLNNLDYIGIKFFVGLLFLFINFTFHLFKLSSTNPLYFLISFLIGFFLVDIILYISYKQRKDKTEEDLLNAIIIMNNSFKSGKNIMQAIATVKNELDGPISLEFKKIYMDITYGLSLDVVFARFSERINLSEAKYIASSLTLLNKTGGNIVKVFETIEKNFFNKKKMVDELHSLIASSIFVYRVLITLPIVFTLMILILNPTYFNPLFTNVFGIILFILIILLYILYILVIKKVLKVKM